MFRYLIIAVTILSSELFAQAGGVIRGEVYDAKTKEKLWGVNITLLGTNRGATTSENGKYSIDNLKPGTYRLQYTYIGYSTIIRTDVIVTAAKPVVLDVALMPEAIEGEEIIITAGYFEQVNKTQPSSIGLTQEEIRRYPGGFEDVVRTVSTLPGVAVNNSGGRNDLIVRGGGPSENLYIINNMEVPNINHFATQGTSGGTVSFINLDFVDNVEFSTGGFSARYGDKLSSTLSLNLRKGREDRFGGKALVSATQFGAHVEGPIGSKGDYIVSARRSYLDFIFKAAGFPFIPAYTDVNILGQYAITENDNLYFLSLAAIGDVSKNTDTRKNRIFNAGLMDNRQYQSVTGLNYRHLVDKGYIETTTNINISKFNFAQKDTLRRKYFSSAAREIEWNVKLDYYRMLTKNLGLLSGVSAKMVNNDNETLFGDTIVDRNGNYIPLQSIGIAPDNRYNKTFYKTAGFAELDWLASHHWNFNLGVRADKYTYLNKGLYIAPRLSARYKANEQWIFKASSGLYYQSPSYVWVVNPDNKRLKAMRNVMTIFGTDYLIRKDLKASAEVYYKRYSDLPTGTLPGINDYIVLTNSGAGFGGREDNFQSFGFTDLESRGKGRAYGVEMLLQKKFSEIPLYGQISVTLGKSTVDAANGKTYPNPFDQRFILNITGGYKLNNTWEFSGKFRFFTGAPYTPTYRPSDNAQNPGQIQNLPDEYLSRRLENGHHLDVRVDRYFNFSGWRMMVFMDIQNIYNRKNQNPPDYNFAEDKVEDRGSIGILPSIGISAEF